MPTLVTHKRVGTDLELLSFDRSLNLRESVPRRKQNSSSSSLLVILVNPEKDETTILQTEFQVHPPSIKALRIPSELNHPSTATLWLFRHMIRGVWTAIGAGGNFIEHAPDSV